MASYSTTRRGLLSLGTLTAVGTIALTACSGTPSATSAAKNRQITLYVFPDSMNMVKGSDNKYHDAFVPNSFVVKAGVPVDLQVINYDDMEHTITAADLNLNVVVKPAKKAETQPTTTTQTVTLTKKGAFRWYCAAPCDPWAMAKSSDGPDRDGYMAGNIVVI